MSQAVPAVEFRGVVKRFAGVEVLKGVDLSVAKGEVLVVCGPSGSGKSTLIRLVNQLESLTDGEVLVSGQAVSGLTGRALQQLRGRVGFVFQQFNLYGHLTARGNITLGLRKVQGLKAAEADARADVLLARVGLSHRADAYPAQLSGGQQQRVAIARALASEPDILLFDEPTSALDPEAIGEVLDVMRSLAHDVTMIVVTHEMGFARALADRIAFLDDGVLLQAAPPSVFFGEDAHPRAKRFLQRLTTPFAEPA